MSGNPNLDVCGNPRTNELNSSTGERVALKINSGSVLFENRKKLMNVNELANYLSISRSHIYKMIADEGMPKIKIGRSVRFDLGKVELWLAKRSHSS